MPQALRIVSLLLVFSTLLTACANTAAQATEPPNTAPNVPPSAAPTSAPTQPPSPTPLPKLASNIHIAGVPVGDLLPDEAAAKLKEALSPLLRQLEVKVGDVATTIRPNDIDLEVPIDAMIAEARAAKSGAQIKLQVHYNETKLRALLEQLTQQVDLPASITVISDTKTISRSFVISGGVRLDLDLAVRSIDERLRSVGGVRRVTLQLTPLSGAAARPSPEQLQEQIEAMAEEWRGVVGIYVYDLDQESIVASLNKGTVFSGASVMKVPIMLFAYLNIKKFTQKQEKWMQKMIIESDNLSANQLLAASMGSSGTEAALEGVLAMTEMLKELGLEHTYQYTPYEAKDYLNLRNIKTRNGPKREGPKPYTDPDPKLRTTPEEMSQVFLLIEQCSRGKGVLLEKFAKQITADRCKEMIERLEKNGDKTRILAGLPKGTRVAHKSGWIEDMQADVGIVRSPGGDFLVAIYVYREIIPGKNYLSDAVAAPVIASFARLVYSYYNPIASQE